MNSLLTVLGFSLLMLIFFLSLSFVFPVFVCLLVYEILWLEVDQPLHRVIGKVTVIQLYTAPCHHHDGIFWSLSINSNHKNVDQNFIVQ